MKKLGLLLLTIMMVFVPVIAYADVAAPEGGFYKALIINEDGIVSDDGDIIPYNETVTITYEYENLDGDMIVTGLYNINDKIINFSTSKDNIKELGRDIPTTTTTKKKNTEEKKKSTSKTLLYCICGAVGVAFITIIVIMMLMNKGKKNKEN